MWTPTGTWKHYRDAGADWLTVHYETCPHLHRTIQKIGELGMKPAVSVNPHTDVSLLEPVLGDLNMVLVMTVNPGFGGQKFIQGFLQQNPQTKADDQQKADTKH